MYITRRRWYRGKLHMLGCKSDRMWAPGNTRDILFLPGGPLVQVLRLCTGQKETYHYDSIVTDRPVTLSEWLLPGRYFPKELLYDHTSTRAWRSDLVPPAV